MEHSLRLRAKWILDATGVALDGGILHVVDGRIAALESSGSADVDLGDVAIVPGFVNAHTHLDLSAVSADSLPKQSFTEWLLAVISHRFSSLPISPQETIRKGIVQLLQSGTVAAGDISADGASMGALQQDWQAAAVVFREVLGLRPERYEALCEGARADLSNSKDPIAVSLSPHAPYSTSREIYHRAGNFPIDLPIATHWYETPEEVEFLLTGKGPFRDFLERIGAWTDTWQPSRDPWSDYFPSSGTARWILVHANCITPAVIERLTRPALRQRIAGVVYCPRTHAYFGRAEHPYRSLQQAGIPVALGTDSLASNPDLSVFEEAKYLAAHDSSVAPVTLLEMLTADGAVVLGLDQEIGCLAVGKRADLAVIAAPFSSCASPLEAIFAPDARVAGTIHGPSINVRLTEVRAE